jgi:hypothetical protein
LHTIRKTSIDILKAIKIFSVTFPLRYASPTPFGILQPR